MHTMHNGYILTNISQGPEDTYVLTMYLDYVVQNLWDKNNKKCISEIYNYYNILSLFVVDI